MPWQTRWSEWSKWCDTKFQRPTQKTIRDILSDLWNAQTDKEAALEKVKALEFRMYEVERAYESLRRGNAALIKERDTVCVAPEPSEAAKSRHRIK